MRSRFCFIACFQVMSVLAHPLPAAAKQEPPKAPDIATEEAKQWASAAADAYHDTHLKPAERLEALETAEAKLLTAQKHCGTRNDCVNRLFFGLGCVYEDQSKLLHQKAVAIEAQGKTAEASLVYAQAERRLLAALNAYERFASQRERMTELTEELLDEVGPPPAPPHSGSRRAAPSRADWPLACVEGKPQLTQARAGISWLRERVRSTHGRLIVVSGAPAGSFSIKDTEHQLVKQVEKPLPVWLPAGRYELTWEPLLKEQQREQFAIFPYTDTQLTLTSQSTAPASPPAPGVMALAPLPVTPLGKVSPPPRPMRRWGLLVGGGLSALGGAAGVSLGAVALAVNGQCTSPRCDLRYDGTLLGALALPIGLVALGAGATLLGLGLAPVTRSARPRAYLSPLVGAGQAGAMLVGKF